MMQSVLCYRLYWSLRLALLLSLFMFSLARPGYHKQPGPKEKVPAVFAFGDSIVDPGNNNKIVTIVRCNFPPYGKDFEGQKASGRFSNGRIPSDFFAEALGVKKILPAFLDPSLKDEDLLTGVSFGSSGSGYDPLTSKVLLVKSMKEQLKMFRSYTIKIKEIVGVDKTNFIVNNSIVLLAAGADDIANTYFTSPFRNLDYDVESYTDFLLNFTTPFLKKLYKLGARRIGVSNLAPIGCLPAQRTIAGGLLRECSQDHNDAAQLFNSKLKDRLMLLSTQLRNSKLVYMDLYSMMLDLIQNNTHYGFEVADRGCCGTGLIEGAILCNSLSPLCEDDKYLFWDSYHPTERAYQIIMDQVAQKYIPLFF